MTVTDPDVTRYFMLTSEAVGLVLQAATMGKGGDIFVLDMGTPVKIDDLARQMIELSGLQPGVDIEIEYIGLRPGEKGFEEISLDGEEFTSAGHEKIFRFMAQPEELKELENKLNELRDQLADSPSAKLKQAMQKLAPEYTPSDATAPF